MDEADSAQVYEEQARARGIVNATLPSNEEPLIINNVRACIDCEEQVNKKRLKAKPDAVRCIFCQSRYEKERRR